jgi:hypothetical protein
MLVKQPGAALSQTERNSLLYHILDAADPVSEEDAAKEGAFPFTTITPNVGRGFIALPDPSPLLGFRPDQVQPAYGFAPGLDISRVAQAGFSNIGPLQQLVKDCGWQQPQQETGSGPEQLGGDGILWRRVPVVVKDVAGLVPGIHCWACLVAGNPCIWPYHR